MKFNLLAAMAAIGLGLAACVAPEEPDPPRVTHVAPAVTGNQANFEDAPVPNRQITRTTNDSVISIGH